MPAPPELPEVLLAGDLGASVVRAGLRAGELIRVARGTYLPADPTEPRWQARRRAVLARAVACSIRLHDRTVLSHTTAALLHGCWLWRMPAVTHVTEPSPAPGRRNPKLATHLTKLPSDDIVVHRGLSMTSLDRTVIDCTAFLDPREGLTIADSALRLLVHPVRSDRAGTEERAAAVRARWHARLAESPGRRGVARARAVISCAEPWAESPGESVLRWLVLSSGLPSPVLQAEVVTPVGRFFTDAAWCDRADAGGHLDRRYVLHAEVDGWVKYAGVGGEAALRREKEREDAIREVSAPVRRFTTRDLDDRPELVVERLRSALPERIGRCRPVRGLTVTRARTGP